MNPRVHFAGIAYAVGRISVFFTVTTTVVVFRIEYSDWLILLANEYSWDKERRMVLS